MKTLFEILPDFLNGKKIRRASWGPLLWMETTDGYTTRLMIKEADGIRLLHLSEDFSLSDVRANDWIIVDLIKCIFKYYENNTLVR